MIQLLRQTDRSSNKKINNDMGEWSWLGWFFGFVATIFAIRGSVQFDVNAWLKDRREQKIEKIRSLCPHAYVSIENGRTIIRSAYISPSGTLAWQCQMCGDVTHDDQATEQNTRYWAQHAERLIHRHKEINELTSKL